MDLVGVHAEFFNPDSLRRLTGNLQPPVPSDAVFDWQIFGAWCVAVGIFDHCYEGRLRTRVVDEFLERIYRHLRGQTGEASSPDELPRTVQSRFEEYYRASLEPHHPGSKAQAVGRAAARRILGDQREESTDALVFGIAAVTSLGATRKLVGEIYDSMRLDAAE